MTTRAGVFVGAAFGILASLLVAMARPPQGTNSTQIYAAGKALAPWGVKTYYVTVTEKEVSATLGNASDETVGRFVATPVTQKGTDIVELEWKGEQLKVVWDKAASRIDFIRNGAPVATGTRDAASQLKTFMTEEAEDFAVLRALIDDFRRHGLLGPPKQTPGPCGPRAAVDPAERAVEVAGRTGPHQADDLPGEIGCGGGSHYECGWPAWTRSGACESATLEAGEACSNQWCWGCCRLNGDCDCICLEGDFICDCCMGGESCLWIDQPIPASTLGK